MNRNKKIQRQRNRKAVLLLASLFLIVFAMIGSTVAYLVTGTGELVNTFTPAKTGSDIIDETFKNNVKENVRVTNNGDIAVYVRAREVIYWVDKDSYILATPPADGTYTVTYSNSENWIKGTDGFYYYKTSVGAGTSTDILIQNVTWIPPKNGEKLIVDIIAETIQLTPDEAVLQAWGTANGGSVIGAFNGTLTIAASGNN